MHPKKSKKKTKFHLTKVLSYDMIDEVRQKVYRMQNPKRYGTRRGKELQKARPRSGAVQEKQTGRHGCFSFKTFCIHYTIKKKSSISSITNNKFRRHSGGKKE